MTVSDEGPGIPDLDLALTEGWSTASAEARALGFGAGLGLPNIRNNSDEFTISSDAGAGTTVRFSVFLRPQVAAAAPALSLQVVAELCRDCRRCLTACPTGAVRVREGVPSVLEHLCIDCTCCIAACPTGALALADTAPDATPGAPRPIAVPPAFLAGFGERVAAADVAAALAQIGYSEVATSAAHEAALRAGCVALAAAGTAPQPVLSPVCPAVVDLVELRFPSLIGHLAPLASPWEALYAEAGQETTFVVSCPAQRSALLARGAAASGLLEPHLLRDAVLPVVAAAPARPAAGLEPLPDDDGVLRVTGIAHVLAVLERVEDGLLTRVPAIELFVCDGGCFGSPLLAEDPYVARARWAADGGAAEAPAAARGLPRATPYAPRPGIRLDDDMAEAIAKLGRLDTVRRSLPGKDCGACGAPTCAALAEDVVLDRATVELCPYLPDHEV